MEIGSIRTARKFSERPAALKGRKEEDGRQRLPVALRGDSLIFTFYLLPLTCVLLGVLKAYQSRIPACAVDDSGAGSEDGLSVR